MLLLLLYIYNYQIVLIVLFKYLYSTFSFTLQVIHKFFFVRPFLFCISSYLLDLRYSLEECDFIILQSTKSLRVKCNFINKINVSS